MFYREAGQYKTTYKSDNAIFPILQDRIAITFYLIVAFIVIPLTGSDFFINGVMIPFLIFSLAAIGLNILTGYTGQISLGTGAFMKTPKSGFGALDAFRLASLSFGANGPRPLALQGAVEQFPGTLRRKAVGSFRQGRIPAFAQGLQMAFRQARRQGAGRGLI